MKKTPSATSDSGIADARPNTTEPQEILPPIHDNDNLQDEQDEFDAQNTMSPGEVVAAVTKLMAERNQLQFPAA